MCQMQAYFLGNEAFSYLSWQAVAGAASWIQLSCSSGSKTTPRQSLTVSMAFVSCLNSFSGILSAALSTLLFH